MKKHLVLLISQKDYEHIYKCEVWDRDSELRNWNWLNVDCLTEILQVKCVGGFNGGLWKWIVVRYFSLVGPYNWIEKASSTAFHKSHDYATLLFAAKGLPV